MNFINRIVIFIIFEAAMVYTAIKVTDKYGKQNWSEKRRLNVSEYFHFVLIIIIMKIKRISRRSSNSKHASETIKVEVIKKFDINEQ
jgi:heme/copper-type cytochrome/quinol oxidase subunit 2